MEKKRRILLAAVLALVLGGVALLAFRSGPREPVYQARTLTFWLEQFNENPDRGWNKEAEASIRHIGTNAIPLLLNLMSTRESPVIMGLLAPFPRGGITSLHVPGVLKYQEKIRERHHLGALGFVALGEAGEPAVPVLIPLLNDKDTSVRFHAAYAVGWIGPGAREALPSLIKCLDNPQVGVRAFAVLGLGAIHQEPERVIPVLTNLLQKWHASTPLCAHAIKSLELFGTQAKPAVPMLFGFLNDKDVRIRTAATNALKQIDPEATVEAEVK